MSAVSLGILLAVYMHVQLVLTSAVYGVKSLCVWYVYTCGCTQVDISLLNKSLCVCVCVLGGGGCLTFALIHGFLAGVSYIQNLIDSALTKERTNTLQLPHTRTFQVVGHCALRERKWLRTASPTGSCSKLYLV